MMLGSELVGVEFVGLSFDECVALLVEMGFESEKNKSFDQRTINEFASSLDTIINKYKKEFC